MIEGPWHKSTCFYLDVRTGECVVGSSGGLAVGRDDLTEEEIVQHWDLVEEADLKEIKQFVDLNVWKKISLYDIDIAALDAIWVRKWKKLADGTWIVKSRLRVRGFLDLQKTAIPTRSTTASRLSHKLFMSLTALLNFEFESWDVSGAFLKGFTFDQLDALYKRLGMDCPKRRVVIRPPSNVWRFTSSGIWVEDWEVAWWLLELLKAMYGRNDAPFAFQARQSDFFVEILEAIRRRFDENFMYWLKGPGCPVASASSHVDDNELSNDRTPQAREWKEQAHKRFEEKFGDVKRVEPPLDHCGVRYTELPYGLKMDQNEFTQRARPMHTDPSRAKAPHSSLTSEEMTGFRGVSGALLWMCITRLDALTETILLQEEVTRATIAHALAANALLIKLQKVTGSVGLYFPRMTPQLRLVSIHDACGTKANASYAQEGILIPLKEDRKLSVEKKTCILDPKDWPLLGGPSHPMHANSKTAKRIGVSTSKKETVCAVGAKEIAQLIAMRYTEVLGAGYTLPLYRTPTVEELIHVQENCLFCFAIDDMTDCADSWALMTGQKGVPQDRHQRLYVLSLREDRMIGKIRHAMLTPTEIMAADPLTKRMVSLILMNLITSGYLIIRVTSKEPVRIRTRTKSLTYTEQDLLDLDG